MIANSLRGHDIWTPNQMAAHIANLDGVHSVHDDASVWNFESLENHIPSGSIKRNNVFEFSRCAGGIQMRNKQYMRSNAWGVVGKQSSTNRRTSVVVVAVRNFLKSIVNTPPDKRNRVKF